MSSGSVGTIAGIGVADSASVSMRSSPGDCVAAVHDGQHRDAGELGALGALAEQRGGADERLRAGVLEDVLDLLGLEQRVHRHGDGPEGERAEVGEREVRGVRQQQRHLVARADALVPQDRGVLQGVPPQLRVGQAELAEDDRGAVGVADGGLREDAGDGQGHGRSGSRSGVTGVSPTGAPRARPPPAAHPGAQQRAAVPARDDRSRRGAVRSADVRQAVLGGLEPAPRCTPRSRRHRRRWSAPRSSRPACRPRTGRHAGR